MGLARWQVKKTVSGYQQWAGFPESPVSSETFPYQAITKDNSDRYYVAYSQTPMFLFLFGGVIGLSNTIGGITRRQYIPETGSYDPITIVGDQWFYQGGTQYGWVIEANNDIYNDSSLTTVYSAKTTTPAQDAGISTSLVRMRNVRHKTSSLPPHQQWENYPETPVLTDEYAYQCVYQYNEYPTYKFLAVSQTPMYVFNNKLFGTEAGVFKRYSLQPYGWLNDFNGTTSGQSFPISDSSSNTPTGFTFQESNNDIYTSDMLDIVYFSKTTNETLVTSAVLERGVYKKIGEELVRIDT